MKRIEDIAQLSVEDLERISLDESIPVPAELGRRVHRPRPRRAWVGGVAAAVVLLVGAGWFFSQDRPALQDTFTDPYLAYAEVEKALDRIGGTLSYGAAKVSETQETLESVLK